jgi:predicted neuraminidase
MSCPTRVWRNKNAHIYTMIFAAIGATLLLTGWWQSAAGARVAMRSESAFDAPPFSTCHASTIVELQNGDLLVAWYGGSAEEQPDEAIWMSRFTQGHWTAAEVVARERDLNPWGYPGVPAWNPVLFRAHDGRIWLFYKVGPTTQTWTGAFRVSSDGGRTWTPREFLPAGLLGPIKDKPIQLAGGEIVAGSSVESYRSWACWVERSTDNGKTWTKHGPITVRPGAVQTGGEVKWSPEKSPRAAMSDDPYGLIQPSIVETATGKLRAFMRSGKPMGKIYYSDSSDGGVTWTEAVPTTLPNPSSGIDTVRLQDGRILIVYNDSSSSQTPLNVAISSDGGERWEPLITLEDGPGEFAYPAVVQTANGDVHIVYTWNRIRIKHVVLSLNGKVAAGGS